MKITVRVIPNAKTLKVEKHSDGTLKVWVTGKPFRGAATLEVIDALSAFYKIPKSLVTIVKGLTSRNKVFNIDND
jgi:uncharacterized protein YggU (UPF0235/DUF167 family)